MTGEIFASRLGRHPDEAVATALCDWFRANGEDPREIAGWIAWTPTLIDITTFMTHPVRGNRYRNPINRTEAARTTRRVEVAIPFPSELAEHYQRYTGPTPTTAY